jgi:hypothetical protein
VGRRPVIAWLAVALALSAGPGAGALRAAGEPGPPAVDAEADFVARIGAERAGRGLGALTVAADLTAVARRHAARMAAEGRLYHNPNLATDVTGYRVVGENVGDGGSVADIHAAFMASATHRRQILRPGYREVGVGVVQAGELLWVTEVFREPLVAGPAEATPPPPPPPRVRPASRPATRPAPPAPPATPPTAPAVPAALPAVPVERLSPPAPAAASVAGREMGAAAAAAPLPAPQRLPAAAAAAAALLVVTVALQHAAVRRLGLVGTAPRARST